MFLLMRTFKNRNITVVNIISDLNFTSSLTISPTFLVLYQTQFQNQHSISVSLYMQINSMFDALVLK